jgi:2,3-dihydroxybenzoate-AMP ligase
MPEPPFLRRQPTLQAPSNQKLCQKKERDRCSKELFLSHRSSPPDSFSLSDLIERPATRAVETLALIAIDPTDPALFLLSGGTTGIPKLIPLTHNDYVFNSKLAVSVCDVHPDDTLLLLLPIGHTLPLACPGLQGFLLSGARVVLSTSMRATDVFALIERHRVTHIHVVPALLIRWINDPIVAQHDVSSLCIIQSGGQRLQPNVRTHTERVLGCTVQENFGMAKGLTNALNRWGYQQILQ